MPEDKPREGWISIMNSKKYHYVIGNMTVCKKFLYLGKEIDGPWTGKTGDDDCKACVKFLQKRDEKNAS